MKVKINKVQHYLLYFLVFFIVFDGVRSNLTISGLISPFRELGINLFIITCIPLLKRCTKKYLLLALPFIGISCMAIINIPITAFNDLTSYNIGAMLIFDSKYSAIYKHVIFSLIFLCLLCYTEKNKKSAEQSINLFINLAALYSIITIPIYLYGFPLFRDDFRDFGRMGIGYPTMDGQMICFAIFSLIFLAKQKNILLFNIKMAALLIGIVAQNTGTAMVTMLFITMLSLFLKPRKTIIYAIIIIPAISLLLIKQYYSNPQFFTDMLYIATNKYNQLVHPELTSQASLDTLQMRVLQYEGLERIINNNFIFNVFGVGGQAYIENEFRLVRAAYGIITFILFIASFFWITILTLRSKNKNKILIISLMVIWGLSSYTLSSIHLFTTSFCFCFIFSYCYVQGLMDND